MSLISRQKVSAYGQSVSDIEQIVRVFMICRRVRLHKEVKTDPPVLQTSPCQGGHGESERSHRLYI